MEPPQHLNSDHELWDFGRSLYDSFELRFFQHQLNSTISSSSARTLSMPRLPNETRADYETLHPPSNNRKPTGSKISCSLHKLVRLVFRKSWDAASASYYFFEAHARDMNRSREGRYVFVYDKLGALSTILKAPEREHGDGAGLPQLDPLVRKTRLERFITSTGSTHIPSCA